MRKLWLVTLVLVIIFTSLYFLYKSFFSAKHIAKIINKNKENYSIIFSENDSVLININPEVVRPLASVVKLIIAIEFAEQIASKELNDSELVSIIELQKYYIPNTDGNAHTEWIDYLEKNQKIVNDSLIPLWEIARGMISFSSNANTEYLLDKLGIEKVNEQIHKLGIKKHSHIKYLVSEIYQTMNDLETNSDNELYEKGKIIHEKLKFVQISNDSFNYEKDLSINKQKLLNNRMSSSTAKEYYELLKKIASNNYFTKDVQDVLNSIIERKSQSDKYDIIRYGGKGGSTLWVLNNVAYLERKNGKQYILILFSDYPTENNDNLLISKVMGELINGITSNSKRSNKLINIINK